MISSDKKVLVIGASGGIGRTVSRLLSLQGRSLVLSGRNSASLQKTVDDLHNPDAHEILVADITTDIGRIALACRMEQGDIEHLINISGINELSAFTDQTANSIEQIINTNLTSMMLLTREILVRVNHEKPLSITYVGSTLGAIGIPGYATYCASKFALRGFCEALSRELSDCAIKIKYFAPRSTQTTMNSDVASAMNTELGNKVDSVNLVARELLKFIDSSAESLHIGWPEKLFVKINGAFPLLVSNNLKKQLPIVRKYIG
ncbi:MULTISPECIES: SDR family oxidoreductase [unclassified Neptuniibacter]|uniref:SDR family oxidoreductase n=1 Tax=unclassified Neptuniibacter TaxID=2630693 RepID=UPI000C61C6F4|nr:MULTISPECIES: SDR family oxidoreductase [unclassified Neptuniibacter]MAY42365.1 short chain dehydrogenase [Oceanospirillaceae bacterium]|tara:strand:+ start:14550 stop:15335 length:786 start_codon:yes stop_codon:yes gene_type:complete